jgi:hypothetical protein
MQKTTTNRGHVDTTTNSLYNNRYYINREDTHTELTITQSASSILDTLQQCLNVL